MSEEFLCLGSCGQVKAGHPTPVGEFPFNQHLSQHFVFIVTLIYNPNSKVLELSAVKYKWLVSMFDTSL